MKNSYKKEYIIFIDLLGFKSLINKSLKSEDEFNLVSKAVIKLQKIKLGSQFKLINDPVKITHFSDSLVLSFEDEKLFCFYLIKVFFKIMDLLQDGILVRGGIDYNFLIHDELIENGRKYKRLFGPAMVNAYELESKYAQYPRIIFQEDVMQILKKNWNNGNFKLFVKKSKYENFYYYDPYHCDKLSKGVQVNHRIRINKKNEKTIEKIKIIIENNVLNKKIREKYFWLIPRYERMLKVHIKNLQLTELPENEIKNIYDKYELKLSILNRIRYTLRKNKFID